MRAKREEGKVSRSRALKKRRGGDGDTHVRASVRHAASWWDAAGLDSRAGATAAESRSPRADRTSGVTVGLEECSGEVALRPAARTQQPEVPDLGETAGDHVLQEALDERGDRERERPRDGTGGLCARLLGRRDGTRAPRGDPLG